MIELIIKINYLNFIKMIVKSIQTAVDVFFVFVSLFIDHLIHKLG